MRRIGWALGVLSVFACHVSAFEGLEFEYKDWYLACDNIGTCRAAGYAPPGQGYSAAVMFSRPAGPATDVSGKLFLGWYEEEIPLTGYALFINGQDMGPVSFDDDNALTAMQVQALLAVVTRDAVIEIANAQHRFGLSGSGASAVFRKMDEYQGRSDTAFAVVAKGNRAESQVPQSQRPESLRVQAPAGEAVLLESDSEPYRRTLERLKAGVPADELDMALEDASLFQAELGAGKRFIAACWYLAYNEMCAHWVSDPASPTPLQSLPSDGSLYVDGIVSQQRKARGIGDCWEFQSWGFDGETMVPTLEASSGPCRGIAGGIDPMPTFVRDVIRPSVQ
ncbi:DUF1176 domain-containing protein [Ferrimonas balearica]|uniref:DUF1176 domain-containing protein n=1 Tax=Ferrimonas balearica TaxID=44012 RepID=UPI001F3FAFAB|nr:DUF1176 domain-containing protein [Ferrimonas balearica]MBY6093421.1 DUF1176 domain-containing protein [Ferrimonas balearica]